MTDEESVQDSTPSNSTGFHAGDRTQPRCITRRKILDLIQADPGISQQELACVLVVSPNTIRYHCRILETNNTIQRLCLGKPVHYWPKESGKVGPRQVLDAVQRSSTAKGKIIRQIIEKPGITLSELSNCLKRESSTIYRHLMYLIGAKIVLLGQSNGSKGYVINPAVGIGRGTRGVLEVTIAGVDMFPGDPPAANDLRGCFLKPASLR